MNKNPKDILDNIPIPDELDERIELAFEDGRKYKRIRRNKFKKSLVGIAASLIIVVGFMGMIGFDKVEAAIKQVLQYVPGYNLVLESDDGSVYVLKDKVFYEDDDIYVKITAASKLNENFNISVESNYGLIEHEPLENIDLFLKDEDDNIFTTDMWSRSGGGEFWKGDYYFQVEDGYSNYFLIVGDVEVPFALEKGTEIEDFLQLGNHASDKGIDIVAIKKVLEDRLMISLLHQSDDKIVEDYPFGDNLFLFGSSNESLDFENSMYIMDSEGNKIYPTLPSSYGNLMSDFYFDIENKEGLKLILPYVKVQYPNIQSAKIRIKTPKDGEIQAINEVVSLGDFRINIFDVRRQGEEIIIRLESDSIVEDELLEDVFLRANFGYGYGPNPQTGDFELFINVKDVGRRFSITFESPTILLFGDWVIDLDK